MNINLVASLLNAIGEEESFSTIEVNDNYVTIDGAEYVIMDEDEVNEALNDHLRETASYFVSSFLANMTELPEKVFEALQDENEAVYELIEKTCGVDEFIEEMVAADGVGHFLASYDGNEYDLIDGYMAFRTN